MILLYAVILLFLAYAFVVIFYWQKWTTIPYFTRKAIDVYKKVSLIIPARNEEQTIGSLLDALYKQDYPSEWVEIIVIDDHSTDNTANIVKQFPQVTLLTLLSGPGNSYKKKAIETGIAAATGEWIITTDADCIPGTQWISSIMAFQQQTNAVFIAAPVSIYCSSRVIELFQAIDFMILQGITGAVVHHRLLSMCNGANLAYKRSVFYEADGFKGIDHIASGDDMLLMHKIANLYPQQTHFLKSTDAIVETEPMKTWSSFFNQRIRWASKATHYKDKRMLPVLLLVYLFNFSFLVLLVASIWNVYWIWIFLCLLIAKTIVELPLLISVSRFFHKPWAARWFLVFQPMHIAYTIISGLFGQIATYEWKGRKVK